MSYFNYTARRSLAADHVAEGVYDLIVETTPDSVRHVQDLKNTNQSLNGHVETQFFGQTEAWDIQLAPVHSTDVDLIREFLDSTADGQLFIFDPYSMDIDTSGWSMSVVRDDSGYTETRFASLGNGGADDFIQFSFRVRSA